MCPDYIPPLAQDLITRMITVDISKRIKMKDIISHPWFTGKKLSFDNDSLIESIWNQVPVTLHNIEEELVQVLGYLGFTDREMLLRSLHSTK